MEFHKSLDPSQGATALLKRLQTELLAGKRVLWLIPGGSNIPTSISIMDGISDELSRGLTLGLTDERYGPEGHKDSNWHQLLDRGFDAKSARRVTVLQSNLKDLHLTAEQYSAVLGDLFAEHDVTIGQFGMGADGHIAGILPNTAAVRAEGLVFGYPTEAFERITMTFSAIRRLQAGYLFAFGDDKRQALEKLQQSHPLSEQPAQILKQLPEAYVYNDQVGGKS